jgi:hypothetical protein
MRAREPLSRRPSRCTFASRPNPFSRLREKVSAEGRRMRERTERNIGSARPFGAGAIPSPRLLPQAGTFQLTSRLVAEMRSRSPKQRSATRVRHRFRRRGRRSAPSISWQPVFPLDQACQWQAGGAGALQRAIDKPDPAEFLQPRDRWRDTSTRKAWRFERGEQRLRLGDLGRLRRGSRVVRANRPFEDRRPGSHR